MATTTEKKTSDGRVAKIVKFFGKKPGQSLSEFAAEYKELTETDKQQLFDGISDGSLNY
jgi:hypothetical protein